MKLVIINGASCSGKSTLIKTVLREKERFFHLSYDSTKWLFSQYSPEMQEEVQKVLFAIANAAFSLHYNIICDAGLNKEWRLKLITMAKENGYEVVEINLEADFEILSTRFEERVRHALANPDRRIGNISKDRFKKLFDMYQNDKNTSAVLFRTDLQTLEEVKREVLKLI